MDWTFVYLMVILKIPIAALFWIVWWAVKAVPSAEAEPPADDGGGGGTKRPRAPTGGRPRPRRRGPHGDPRSPAPPRTRPLGARGKRVAGRQRTDER